MDHKARLGRPRIELDLPDVAEPGLPVAAGTADLPLVAQPPPSFSAAGLPVVAAGLPVSAASRQQARVDAEPSGGAMRELDLPNRADSLPMVMGPNAQLPSRAETLPTAMSPDAHLPRPAELLPTIGTGASHDSVPPHVRHDSGHFGEIELPEEEGERKDSAPPTAGPELTPGPRTLTAAVSPSAVRKALSATASGGMSFGEVDLASADAGADGAKNEISVVASPPAVAGVEPHSATDSASEETFSTAPAIAPRPSPMTGSLRAHRRSATAASRRRPVGPRIALGLVVLALVGGSALELTPYRAFGYLVASD